MKILKNQPALFIKKITQNKFYFLQQEDYDDFDMSKIRFLRVKFFSVIEQLDLLCITCKVFMIYLYT